MKEGIRTRNLGTQNLLRRWLQEVLGGNRVAIWGRKTSRGIWLRSWSLWLTGAQFYRRASDCVEHAWGLSQCKLSKCSICQLLFSYLRVAHGMLIPRHLWPMLCLNQRCTRMREHHQAGSCRKPSTCKRGDFWARCRDVGRGVVPACRCRRSVLLVLRGGRHCQGQRKTRQPFTWSFQGSKVWDRLEVEPLVCS